MTTVSARTHRIVTGSVSRSQSSHDPGVPLDQIDTQARTSRSESDTSRSIPVESVPEQDPQTATALASSPQNHATLTSPSSLASQPSRRLFAVTKPLLAGVTIIVTVMFGIGAWAGQAFGNRYTKLSYEVSLYGLCVDHEVMSIRISLIMAGVTMLIPRRTYETMTAAVKS